jgi:hypothetical protein
MKITYTLKDFDKGRIISKFGLEHEGQTRLYAANRAFIRMHKYTPRDTNTMATTATIKPGSITYEEEYAIYQYKGYTKGPVEHYTTPGTGKYWDRKMWSAEGNKLAKEVSNYMKRISGE